MSPFFYFGLKSGRKGLLGGLIQGYNPVIKSHVDLIHFPTESFVGVAFRYFLVLLWNLVKCHHLCVVTLDGSSYRISYGGCIDFVVFCAD